MRIRAVSDSLSHADRLIARHACGSACIRCACTIIQYCAPVHSFRPASPVLLCPDCLEALNDMPNGEAVLPLLREHPMALQPEFDRRWLPFATTRDIPDVTIGPATTMRQTPYPIAFCGAPVIGLHPPEFRGGPVLLSLFMGDGSGRPDWIVNGNEWVGGSAGWQFERRSNHYCFSSADGKARLVLAFRPNDVIVIEALVTRHAQSTLEIDALGARVNGKPIALPDSHAQLVGANL